MAREPALSDEKKEAARLLAGGMHKADVARALKRNRSTIFTWAADHDFQEHLRSITAAPQKDESMAAVHATAVEVAEAQARRAKECGEDSQGAMEALQACAAALRVVRDTASLGGAPQRARPADQEAARLAAESTRLAKSLRRRLRKANGNGANPQE